MRTVHRYARFDNNIVQLDWIGSCLVYKWHDEEDFSLSCYFFPRLSFLCAFATPASAGGGGIGRDAE